MELRSKYVKSVTTDECHKMDLECFPFRLNAHRSVGEFGLRPHANLNTGNILRALCLHEHMRV